MKNNRSPLIPGFFAALCMLLLALGPLSRPAEGKNIDASYRYAINLISSTVPVDPSAEPHLKAFKGRLLYATTLKKEGTLWHRLRLGFFPSRKAAEKALRTLRGRYGDAWVTLVSKNERKRADRYAAITLKRHRKAAPAAKKKTRRRKPAATKQISKGYAITLFLSLDPIKPSAIPAMEVFKKYRLYTVKKKVKGRNWHLLRLGFFPDRKSAVNEAEILRYTFPDAMVSRASKDEVKNSRAHILKPAARAEVSEAVKKRGALTGGDKKRIVALMDKARKAMTAEKYKSALKLLKRILRYPENKFTRDARELVGLAYERIGDTSTARREYKKYLSLYPKGEGADRVRQRLAGLVTARAKPRGKLRKLKEKKVVTEVYGSFSQFYNRDESYTDLGGSVVNQSSVSTDLDVNVRRRGKEFDINTVFIGGYELDLLGSDSEGRINRFYVDVLNRDLHLSLRAGRQWSSTGGVLGRFDGGILSFSYFPRVKINLVSGFPVESTVLSKIDTDKRFYGLNMDLGTFAKHFDFNVFIIQQDIDGITDRRATGGEVRFSHPSGSFFSLVDYDISYSELNLILIVGNWILPNKATVNFSIDYRKSPSLATSNALQGQTVTTVAELLSSFTEDEVNQLALDRTAENWSVVLGGTYPLSEKFQVSGDFTVSEVTSTDASGGAEAVPGTGPEYFISTQLIGSSLIKTGDIAILGLRYSDASTSNTVSLNMNTRFPITREWRVNPRFRLDYSQNDADSGTQFKIRPTLRTDYFWRRRVRLEFEGGVEWAYDRVSGQTDLTRDYFIRVGYRLDF
ncbi:MAG: SPOR domain-containing protein [Thermodesulfobacteriota bacterium]